MAERGSAVPAARHRTGLPMFLAIWIACGAALAATLIWRLRVAAATLRAILDEPVESALTPEDWHHPPRRLWADR